MDPRMKSRAGGFLLTVILSVGLLACGKKDAEKDIRPGADEEAKASLPILAETEDNERTPEAEDVVLNTLVVSGIDSVTDDIGDMNVTRQANGIAAMADGSLLITDTYNKVIWQVKDGVGTIYAGAETVKDPYGEPMGGYNDDDWKKSFFAYPYAVAPFYGGWAVSDSENNAVRLILGGKVQTVNGRTTEDLKTGGLGVIFDHPTGLASDRDGNLYVSDTYNGAVRMITPEGEVSTFAEGLEEPTGLCWKDGMLYIAETGANKILICENGRAELLAGCGEDDYVDGAAQEAAFAHPQGITVGNDGAVYVADTGNSAVRKIQDGSVTTVLSRDRTSADMVLVSPVGIMLQGKKLYICDNFTGRVLQVSLK